MFFHFNWKYIVIFIFVLVVAFPITNVFHSSLLFEKADRWRHWGYKTIISNLAGLSRNKPMHLESLYRYINQQSS